MEIIEAFANLISEHGVSTIMAACAFGVVIWKGKTILKFLGDTYNAAQVVKLHEQTIIEQRKQIEMMQDQIDKLNETILKYVEEIAIFRTRLERYEEHFAKKVATSKRRNNDADND